MQTQTGASANEIQFPVDDATYDLLQALTSKLESIDAYRTYMEDSQGGNSQLFAQLAREDISQAERLLDALRRRLTSGGR